MNVLASTGPFQHILGLNLDLCALLRLFQLFPLKLTVWGGFFGGGVRGTVPSSKLEEMNYEREVGGEKEG